MEGVYIGIIVFAVLLIIVLSVVYLVRKIKRKIREISRMAFHTDSFLNGYRQQETQLAETPRSVNGMTRILLPQIQADFPEFNYDEFKGQAVTVLKAYLNAVEDGNTEALKRVEADELVDAAREIITDLNSQGQKAHFDDVRVHQTEISDYSYKDGCCVVRFQSSVGHLVFVTDETGKVVSGSKELKRQTVYETDLTYIQDVSLLKDNGKYTSYSLNCPNCGAPVKNLGTKFCEYCGTGIKEINIHSWHFTAIREINRMAKKII